MGEVCVAARAANQVCFHSTEAGARAEGKGHWESAVVPIITVPRPLPSHYRPVTTSAGEEAILQGNFPRVRHLLHRIVFIVPFHPHRDPARQILLSRFRNGQSET